MSAPTLRTERLVMLPLGSDDLDEAGALYADPDVMSFTDGGSRTRDQTKSVLAAAERCWGAEGWGLWAIRDAETGGLVGEAGLQHLTDVEAAEARFHCITGRRSRGQGLATEACHAILLDMWDRFPGNLIHAITKPDHTAAENLLRKLGFRHVEDRLIHGMTQRLWEIPRLT